MCVIIPRCIHIATIAIISMPSIKCNFINSSDIIGDALTHTLAHCDAYKSDSFLPYFKSIRYRRHIVCAHFFPAPLWFSLTSVLCRVANSRLSTVLPICKSFLYPVVVVAVLVVGTLLVRFGEWVLLHIATYTKLIPTRRTVSISFMHFFCCLAVVHMCDGAITHTHTTAYTQKHYCSRRSRSMACDHHVLFAHFFFFIFNRWSASREKPGVGIAIIHSSMYTAKWELHTLWAPLEEREWEREKRTIWIKKTQKKIEQKKEAERRHRRRRRRQTGWINSRNNKNAVEQLNMEFLSFVFVISELLLLLTFHVYIQLKSFVLRSRIRLVRFTPFDSAQFAGITMAFMNFVVHFNLHSSIFTDFFLIT